MPCVANSGYFAGLEFGAQAARSKMQDGEDPTMSGSSSSSSISSLRSQEQQDDPAAAAASRMKFLCSYGGALLLRPHDRQLRYVGGHTRMVVLHRAWSCQEVVAKLSKLAGKEVVVKYQLPDEDLDALLSLLSDDDLDFMWNEVEKRSSRDTRLRIFLFPKQQQQQQLSDQPQQQQHDHVKLQRQFSGSPPLPRIKMQRQFSGSSISPGSLPRTKMQRQLSSSSQSESMEAAASIFPQEEQQDVAPKNARRPHQQQYHHHHPEVQEPGRAAAPAPAPAKDHLQVPDFNELRDRFQAAVAQRQQQPQQAYCCCCYCAWRNHCGMEHGSSRAFAATTAAAAHGRYTP